MVEVSREARSSSAHWGWTALVAVLAFLVIGFAEMILVAAAYSDAVDKPSDPSGVAITIALALVPFIVAVYSYRNGRRRGLAGDAAVRMVSLILLGVALVLLTVIVLLSAPF
jgi:hypothetical protein